MSSKLDNVVLIFQKRVWTNELFWRIYTYF